MGLLSTIGSASGRAFGFTRSAVAAVDAYFNLTTLLLNTSSTNGAHNNTFLDSSSSPILLTTNGTPAQGTFTPFSQTGWSNYFDGTQPTALRTAVNSNYVVASGGNVTIELWINTSVATSNAFCGTTNEAAWTSTSWALSYSGGNINLYNSAGGGNLWSIAVPTLNDGQWHHIAVVRNSGTWQVFTDGVSRGTTTTEGTRTLGEATWRFTVGCSEPGGNDIRFTGYISNFRFTKAAVYTSNFTPSTVPLAPEANTVLLTCKSNRFLDTSSVNTSFTLAGKPSIQAFSPFLPAAYDAAVVGGSGYFVSATDYLALTGNSVNVGSSDFSLEVWIYVVDRSSTYYIFGGQSDRSSLSGSSYNFHLTNSNGYLSTELYIGNSSSNFVSTTAPPLNAWSHVVFARTGGTASMFLNGIQVATNTGLGTSAVNNGSTTFLPAIGSNATGNAATFTGYMSNLRFIIGSGGYNATSSTITVPTALVTSSGANTKLLANFTNANIFDSAAKNDLRTIGSAQVSTTQAKWGTTSMYFANGGADYLVGSIVNDPNFTFPGDFTVELWLYVTSTPDSYNCIIGNFSETGTTYGWNLMLTSGRNVHVNVQGASANSVNTVSLNTWTHLAIARSGSTVSTFINGTKDTNVVTQSATAYNPVYPLRIGRQVDTTPRYFFGYMDDIRITKGYARYTANFTPPTEAFLLK